MAELGETGDPRQLVPGDPAAIEENVVAIRGRGRSMERAGDNLKKIDSGAWTGDAGNAFRDKFSYEPPRWHTAGDAFEATAAALAGYATTLRWAQQQAGEAIRLWREGEAATQQARTQHEAAVARVAEQNRANAAAGDPSQLPEPPFTDPGEAQRQAARDLLGRARQQLTEAGDQAAETIRARGDEAPQESFWGDVGDVLGEVGEFAGDFAEGAWETVSGTAELLWDLSPHHLITDPAAYGETWKGLGQTVASAVSNPVEFGKQLIGWEHWKNGEPGRALGQLAGGAILGLGTGKAAAAIGKMRKAGAARPLTRGSKLPPARDLIDRGTEWKGTGRGGGKLPTTAEPNQVLYRKSPQTGNTTNYAVYDDNGLIIKRVDLEGRPHAGVETPHVVDYQLNQNPNTGEKFPGPASREPRRATPEEIP